MTKKIAWREVMRACITQGTKFNEKRSNTERGFLWKVRQSRERGNSYLAEKEP